MSEKKRGLGRGLSALMADIERAPDPVAGIRQNEEMVPIENISPNPAQPRKDFDDGQLAELAQSIESRGIIQPLVVRADPSEPGKYQIVAGERRWRAAQIAQLHEVPVVVRSFSDEEVLEVAIIENVQRENLNPIEEAVGYKQLIDKFKHTQEQLASGLGKSRSHIANTLRLLQLPEDVQALVRDGQLSAGHARALITAENPSELAKAVVKNQLSVRETERLAKTVTSPEAKKRNKARTENKDPDTRALEGDLSAALGMKVEIMHEPGGETGRVVIKYGSLDALDDLCRILSSPR